MPAKNLKMSRKIKNKHNSEVIISNYFGNCYQLFLSEYLESENEKFKNVIENKDFVLLANATQIKYIENDIEKSVDEIKIIQRKN